MKTRGTPSPSAGAKTAPGRYAFETSMAISLQYRGAVRRMRSLAQAATACKRRSAASTSPPRVCQRAHRGAAMATETFDVCVIGTGAGGGVMIQELTAAG